MTFLSCPGHEERAFTTFFGKYSISPDRAQFEPVHHGFTAGKEQKTAIMDM